MYIGERSASGILYELFKRFVFITLSFVRWLTIARTVLLMLSLICIYARTARTDGGIILIFMVVRGSILCG